MSDDKGKPRHVRMGKMVWIGIGLGVLYWILESAINAVVFHEGDLVGQILAPGAHEVWVRSLTVCILVAFGVYVQFAIAERKRAEEKTRQRTAQLEALREVELELTAQLDLDVLLRSIASRAVELLEGTGGGLYLYRPEQDVLEWVMSVGSTVAPAGTILHRGEGLSGKVLETGEPLIVDDYQHWEERAAVYEGYPFIAVVGVPVRWGDEFLGVVNVVAAPPRTFSPADAELLGLFATQAAAAIHNARLFDSLAREKERLGLLYRLSHHLSESPGIHDVAQRALDDICAVVGAMKGVALVREPGSDRLRLVAVSGYDAESVEVLNGRIGLRVGDGLAGWVAAQRQSALVEDVTKDERWRLVPGVDDRACSALSVPLLGGDELVGVLSIYGDREGFFDEEHLRLVESAAATVAAAIASARLYEQARRRALEQGTLREAALALTTALDRDEVVGLILAQLQEVVPYDSASVQLLRTCPERGREGDRLEIVGGRGFPNLPDLLGLSFPVDGDNPNSEVIRTRAPFIVEDAPAVYGGFQREPYNQAGIRSWLGVPMLVGERLVGMIALDKREPAFYTEEHARLAEAFAAQAAIAIENARLFQAEREQRELAERLRETTLLVNSSLDLQEVLELILEQLARVIPYDSGSVQILEPDATRIIAIQNLPPQEMGRRYPLDQFPYNRRLAEGEGPIVVGDTHEDSQEWITIDGLEHIRATIGVSLKVRDRVIGILTVHSRQPGVYTGADARIVQAFAQQAAIAIENARLFQAEQEQRELAEALAEAAAAVGSTLDLDQVLDRILDQVERVVTGDACNIMLIEDGGARMVRWRGYERMDIEVLGISFPIAEYSGLEKMVQTGKPVVVPDTTADPGWVVSGRWEWLCSYVGAPIQVTGLTVGFLNVDGTRPGQFGPADARRLEAFAGHAAAAIENAQLYRELLNYTERLEERVRERTAQIQAQYARLDAILRSTSDGIVVIDTAGEILHTNPVAHAWLTRTLSPEDAARLWEMVRDLAGRAEERPEEVLELTGLDLQLSAAPISEPGVEGAAAVVMLHDVSHLKALDRLKSRFVSNVSHELRTPITTIKLYVHLMRRRPEKREQYLDMLEQETDHQVRLVEDILQISRIDAGRLEVSPRPIPLNELTEAVVSGHQVLAEDREVVLEHHPAEPGPVALVDPDRLMQVLNNLVRNGIQYTPGRGQVMVSTGKEEAQGRVWATVTVTDTGMGIPEEELSHIFDRFYRGERPRAMQISGTGLGLAIVKDIVELHGGRVTVESRVGEGAVFTIWLPSTD